MTDASLTSEPEKLLPEAREFFALECEKHGFDTQAAAIRAGNISYEDGGQVCVDAMIAFIRHRLSSPVSGTDMAAADWVNSIPGVKPSDQFIALDRRLFEDCITRALSASPTPPIPVIAEVGERERVAKAINRANWASDEFAEERWQDENIRTLMFSQADAALVALSTPATLDNTAVEGRQALALRNIEAAITQSLRDWEGSTRGDAFSVALSIVQRERATLTAKTEKAE